MDASFWVALFYRRDEHHISAQSSWRELDAAGWLTITTNWTLYEALTFLHSGRRRHDLAVEVLAFVSNSSEIAGVEAAQLEGRSLDIFRHHSDKLWSVVDCANFACIEQRQSDYAASYDRDFQQVQNEFNFRLFSP